MNPENRSFSPPPIAFGAIKIFGGGYTRVIASEGKTSSNSPNQRAPDVKTDGKRIWVEVASHPKDQPATCEIIIRNKDRTITRRETVSLLPGKNIHLLKGYFLNHSS